MSDVDDALMHYGVKGMKWGKRKKRDGGGDNSPASPGNADAGPKRKLGGQGHAVMKARAELKGHQDATKDAADRYQAAKKAGDKAGMDKAERDWNDSAGKMITADVMSQRMTGAEVVGLLLAGPIGSATVRHVQNERNRRGEYGY